MRRLLHFALFFAGVATASAWIGVAAADGQGAGASELQGLITAAHFEEPLVRVTQTSAAEDVALSETLLKRQAGGGPKVLQAYARDYPRSGWTPAIERNLGLSALRAGYFTEALSAFESAWTVGRDATDPQARLVVDLAGAGHQGRARGLVVTRHPG